jgi:hypothetical protein
VLDWQAADFVSINNSLSSVDWHSLFGYCFTANDIWVKFKEIVWPIIHLYVPLKLINHFKKYRPRYYPKEIRKLLSKKAALWRIMKTNNNPSLKLKYCQITHECKTLILEFDKKRETKLLESNNLGAFYKFINNKLSNKSGVASLKSRDGILLNSDLDKANLLNSYFESVFTTDNGHLPPFPPRISPQTGGLSDITITPHSVHSVLTHLKTNSAAGPDGLPSIFYRTTASSLAFPLSVIFRTLLDLHAIPDEWKLSVISPIFKKGSPSDPANYRPIALTCTICKILESLISNVMLDYLLTHNLITKHQHGFIRHHSTTTNLLESLHDWSVSLSRHRSVDVAYIDFQRAFDSISHPKLILKLAGYGISDNLLCWISAFLTNRKQTVRLNSTYSSICDVISGVPQGSVLGPLLFIIFINDITDNLDQSTTAKLFADDIKLYSELSFSHNLQTQLDNIHSWSSVWQLSISYSKCNILHVGSKSNHTPYHISSHLIKPVDFVKDLGVLIEPDLKFTRHINDIVCRANQRSALILRCFLSKNTPIMTRAFKIYVRPLLEYASSSWSPSTIGLITHLESVQRSFTKRLPGLNNLSYVERLSALNLQSLEHRRLLTDLTMVYKINHKQICINFSDFFTLPSYTSTRGHSHRIAVPLAKNNILKNSFSSRVVPVWNALPNSVVLAPSVSAFKRLLSKIDLSKFLLFSTT